MFLISSSDYAIRKTKKKGRAVFAKHDITMGTVIGDYTGTIVRPEDENEGKDGLYTMEGGKRYDIIAYPNGNGLHCVNHSCASNAGIYPYRGHQLFIALRKIFAGEEITINYTLGKADSDETITCEEHACHCGSKFCTASMHDAEETFVAWEKFLKKQFGSDYNKLPGKYGTQLQPLDHYPAFIENDYPKMYDIFGSEKKSAMQYNDTILPTMTELRKRIRKTGKNAAFPKLRMIVEGVKNGFLLITCL
jgi:uncharacterized protein